MQGSEKKGIIGTTILLMKKYVEKNIRRLIWWG